MQTKFAKIGRQLKTKYEKLMKIINNKPDAPMASAAVQLSLMIVIAVLEIIFRSDRISSVYIVSKSFSSWSLIVGHNFSNCKIRRVKDWKSLILEECNIGVLVCWCVGVLVCWCVRVLEC